MLRVRTTLSGWVGGPGLATHYFQCDTEDAAAVIRCRAHVRDLFTNAYHALLCSNATWLVQTAVDEMTSADGHVTNTFNDATVLTAAGTGGSSQSPPAIAALFRANTATWHAGRRLQGRTFISPLAAGALEVDGTFPNATVATINTALIALIAGLPATDKFVVWHRPVAGAGGLTGDVTSMVLQDKIAVLTSRRD
jgi:hypothetical protein